MTSLLKQQNKFTSQCSFIAIDKTRVDCYACALWSMCWMFGHNQCNILHLTFKTQGNVNDERLKETVEVLWEEPSEVLLRAFDKICFHPIPPFAKREWHPDLHPDPTGLLKSLLR